MRGQLARFGKAKRIGRAPQFSLGHLVKRAGGGNPSLAHARGTIRVGGNPPAQRCNPYPKASRYRRLRFTSAQAIAKSIDTQRVNGFCCGHRGFVNKRPSGYKA